MDLNASMRSGYLAVADKLVPGGFLAMHDVVPPGHIPGNYEIFYEEFMEPGKWEEVCREPQSYFCAWRKVASAWTRAVTSAAATRKPAPGTDAR